MPSFNTLDSADLEGKRVLLRVDLNVPIENGVVTDKTRIQRVLPTIEEISKKGGKVILLAHFGRPKGERKEDEFAASGGGGARRDAPSAPSPSPRIASASRRARRSRR